MAATESAAQVLEHLKQVDFRNGFEDTALQRMIWALRAMDYNQEADQMWSDFCCFSHSYAPPLKRKRLEERYGKDFVDLYLEVDKIANGTGRFEMPEWGTRGT